MDAPAGPVRPTPAPTPAQKQATMTGCLSRELWDVQSIDGYSLQIWLTVGAKDERFNFQPDRVQLIAPTGTPLTTREQAMKYDMIVRSLEAAGIAKRKITLAYEPATRNVFGIAVEWGGPGC